MTIMMMIMTDPFATNLVVKRPVVKGSVVKGATSMRMMMMMVMMVIRRQEQALQEAFRRADNSSEGKLTVEDYLKVVNINVF